MTLVETGGFLLETTGPEASIFGVWLVVTAVNLPKQECVDTVEPTPGDKGRGWGKRLTIHHLPLLAKPAPWLIFSLQHDVVAL